MNKCLIIGNLTRDAELRLTPSTGMAVCKFGLAVNYGFGDKKQTSFINCTAFGKTAEAVVNYTYKGSKVGIESHVQTGSYQNKQGATVYTTDFIIDKIDFLTKKGNVDELDKIIHDNEIDNDDIFQPVDDEDIPF